MQYPYWYMLGPCSPCYNRRRRLHSGKQPRLQDTGNCSTKLLLRAWGSTIKHTMKRRIENTDAAHTMLCIVEQWVQTDWWANSQEWAPGKAAHDLNKGQAYHKRAAYLQPFIFVKFAHLTEESHDALTDRTEQRCNFADACMALCSWPSTPDFVVPEKKRPSQQLVEHQAKD